MIDFHIDQELCVQCGVCAQDCPIGIIKMDEYPEMADQGRCIRCQHCLAVCPTGALSILGVDPEQCLPLKGALPDYESVAALVKGRRSIRKFKPEGVDKDVIRELLDTAHHAPTGVNAQQVLFTVVDDPQTMQGLREDVYERLKGLEKKDGPESRMELAYLTWARRNWEKDGSDGIFRHAPHLLVVSAPKTAPTPVEDCLIAMTTFELLAVARGLGTLWNGMAKWAVADFFPDITARLNLPEDHKPVYAMIFGIPDVKYHRAVDRGPALVNIV